jgi:hemoglobin
MAGVLRLAEAWHQRVLADEIVAHAFSHGFHPLHTERLAAYWGEAWGGPTSIMSGYHAAANVPDGLRIPRWSWDGLEA